ncbi:TonB family protein [Lysobacter sp. F6437]|uniref:TonB family protein n=1 Tax=Lysobacter sp. F6437 TaxID=3459296 RepID=UPI00403DF6CF
MVLADALPLLAETTIAGSAAILVVLMTRHYLRTYFGAGVAYASWSLVPAALAAVLLPAATVATPMAVMAQPVAALPVAVSHGPTTTIDGSTAAMLAWAIGVLFSIAWFALQQRRFRRALGTLRSRGDGLQQSSAIRGLPAAFGLLRPRIVVPADFDQRFSAEQQRLMRAHERSHIRGGDLHLNAAVVALRCLFWFNPLVHLASRRFRHDQELACDQRVITLHPKSRRAYGEAMLKAQLASQALPLGCHWGYGHPLKERIAMLNQPVPTRTRWAFGSAAVCVLTLLVAFTAWAAQPPQVVADQLAGVTGERTPPPRYPAAAIEQGIGGMVVLVVDVDASGRPTAIEVERSEPAGLFDQAAIDAAWQWTFQPEIRGGKPVAGQVRVPIRFEPDAAPSPTVGSDARVLTPPAYPKTAVEQKLTGKVVLVIDVDAAGNPVEVVVESSEPAGVFDQAAVDAAWQWKFNPEFENGKPIASRVRVPVDFDIPPGDGRAGTAPGIDLLALSGAGQVAEVSCDTIVVDVHSDARVCLDD